VEEAWSVLHRPGPAPTVPARPAEAGEYAPV